jgi:hypothetical protein
VPNEPTAEQIRADQIREEERRVRRVQRLVQVASNLLIQSRLPRAEGEALVALVRRSILELFPGREDTYEILYGRRFQRMLDEYTAEAPESSAVILPFPPRP